MIPLHRFIFYLLQGVNYEHLATFAPPLGHKVPCRRITVNWSLGGPCALWVHEQTLFT